MFLFYLLSEWMVVIMLACYFEDAVVGYVTQAHSYKVTEDDIVNFATSWDPMPFHIDPIKAEDSISGGITASGAHIYAIFVHLTHKQARKMAAIAALGIKNLKFVNPVRPGDMIHLEGECIAARESSSKKDRGIVTFHFKLINQNGELVLELIQFLMLEKKVNITCSQ